MIWCAMQYLITNCMEVNKKRRQVLPRRLLSLAVSEVAKHLLSLTVWVVKHPHKRRRLGRETPCNHIIPQEKFLSTVLKLSLVYFIICKLISFNPLQHLSELGTQSRISFPRRAKTASFVSWYDMEMYMKNVLVGFEAGIVNDVDVL